MAFFSHGKKSPPVITAGLFFGLLYFTCSAFAADGAALTLTSHELVIDNARRSVELRVINSGNRSGSFEIDWLQKVMSPEGQAQDWEGSQPFAKALSDKVRVSPRRFTLRPRQSQKLRIAIHRKHRGLPTGEYFSHLRIKTINDNIEDTGKETKGFQLRTLMAYAIPVMWRQKIETPVGQRCRFQSAQQTAADRIDFRLVRASGASCRGWAHIADRKGRPISDPLQLNIYANIDSRQATIKAKKPLPSGAQLIYTDDPAKLSGVLARRSL